MKAAVVTSISKSTSPHSRSSHPIKCSARNHHSRNHAYSPTLQRWMQQDPAGYVDGLNMYQPVDDNPINLIDPLGTDGEIHGKGMVVPNEVAPAKYYNGEFLGVILTPLDVKPTTIKAGNDILEGIETVEKIQAIGDLLKAGVGGYGEPGEPGSCEIRTGSPGRSIGTHVAGEGVQNMADATLDVKGVAPSVVNNFIKAIECSHGFSLWIHVKYDTIQQGWRLNPFDWWYGTGTIYEYVSHDEGSDCFIQCKLGSDPADDGHYGNSGGSFYMPTPAQMKQMIKEAILARGGLPPAEISVPDPIQAGVGTTEGK